MNEKTLQKIIRKAMSRAKELYGDIVDPTRISKMIADAILSYQPKLKALSAAA